MTRTKQREAGSAVPTVNELLEKRSRILGWLSRLDEVDDVENRRVVERVRADYEQRLQAVVEELSVHLDALRRETEGARERMAAAGARHADAEDALHETRLRHRIGEVGEEEWEAGRGGLEEAVAAAGAEREEAAGEVARLDEVLAQIESGVLVPALAEEGSAAGEPDPEPLQPVEPAEPAEPAQAAAVRVIEWEEPQPEPVPEPFVEEEEELPMLPDATLLEPGVGGEEEEEEDDLAFLEELDRAIAASAELTDPQEEGEPEIDTRPRKGMKCRDCGYTNDATAWYCGVCGVELP